MLEIGERPWGKYYVLEDEENYKLKRIEVNAGHRLSYQYHHHRQEFWTVVQGEAVVVLDGVEHIVKYGESIFIPLGAKHRIENRSSELLVFIEVQTGTYFGEDDIIRLVDYTSVGFSSQEGINSKSAEMRQGYLSIAKYLYVTLLIFAVTIIIAQSSSAIFDRQKLLRSMLLRGFEEKIGERLITLETAHLSVPYIISGYSLGVLAALAVAKMSSMDPSKVISSDIVMAAFLLLGSAFIFPFAQLRLLRRKVP